MNYYLLFKNQKKEELIFDINQIGYINTKKKILYTNLGYKFLKRLIALNEKKLLNKVSIISEDGKNNYNAEEFIDFLIKQKIKIQ